MRARDSEKKKKKKEMRVPRKKRKKKIIALHTVLFQSSKMSSGLCTKEVGGGGGGVRACCNKCQWAKKSVPRALLPPHTGNGRHTRFTRTLLTSDIQWQPTACVTESQRRPLISLFIFLFLARPFGVLSATEVLSAGKAKKTSGGGTLRHPPWSAVFGSRGATSSHF